ncbi:MAG: 50S ribosomal protein L24e [Candidatus Asgardarchaeia archaeon]
MRCAFCGEEIEKGTGTIYIRRDGKAFPFCSRKCRVNLLKLKRKTHKVKWIRKRAR